MKKTISYETVTVKDLTNTEYDIGKSMSDGIQEIFGDNSIDSLGEEDFAKGKIRIHIEWLSDDDCDCTGFGHVEGCPNGLQDGEIAF